MTIATLLRSDRLALLDRDGIESFNRKAREKYQLHPELGPSAYEGDIDNARVVLLFANPGFDSTSTLDDHKFSMPGWPLAGLHPDAPSGLRGWWHARLRHLIERFGAHHVSRRVACLQATPWASGKFHEGLRLPSRESILSAASQCAARGSVVVVMRAERLWLESPTVASSPMRFRVNSWLSSFVSPGNLPEPAWAAVLEAVGDA
jgi:hypothetical protein